MTVFAFISRFAELVDHWLITLVRRPLTNQSQGFVFSPNQIQISNESANAYSSCSTCLTGR